MATGRDIFDVTSPITSRMGGFFPQVGYHLALGSAEVMPNTPLAVADSRGRFVPANTTHDNDSVTSSPLRTTPTIYSLRQGGLRIKGLRIS